MSATVDPTVSTDAADTEAMDTLRKAEERWDKGLLGEYEVFWQQHYSWLKDSGYQLRPRYSPDRIPSRMKPGFVRDGDIESEIRPPFSVVADATRISDGSLVLIKKSEPAPDHVPAFHEDRIFRKLSSEPLASDPKNRCIQMIEILDVPDDPKLKLIVMPFYYEWQLVPFLTIGEAVDFFSQIFEGLHFMHTNHIWHGDVKTNNILMDASPLLVDAVHPWVPDKTRDLTRSARFRRRLRHPVKYYLIDFNLSGEHDPSAGPPTMPTPYGGTRGVPEFAGPRGHLCDPFPVDVWCLGYVIQEYFTEGENIEGGWKKQRGFEFVDELVADMMNEDPAKRPTMDEVVRRFSEIRAGLSGWKLRSPFAPVDESPLSRTFKFIPHWLRQLYYTLRKIPAIPTP